ncbi:hypothetical protein SK128_011110 [Halocaridina rubra]|uniref:Uncharacterized protein n=1 Tax=Halocaridina rubra TaxID=373956 RepID=A0AAN8WJA4_HALRR
MMIQRKQPPTYGFSDFENREDLEADPQTGRPGTSKNYEMIDAVRNIIERKTVIA